jgi:hypothetical protein
MCEFECPAAVSQTLDGELEITGAVMIVVILGRLLRPRR